MNEKAILIDDSINESLKNTSDLINTFLKKWIKVNKSISDLKNECISLISLQNQEVDFNSYLESSTIHLCDFLTEMERDIQDLKSNISDKYNKLKENN